VTEVADIGTSSNDGILEELVAYDGALYFAADDGTSGRELFVYEPGTGLSLVKDINPNGDAAPQDLTVFDGRLYFSAENGTDGREPYAYDGTTVNHLDFNPGSPSGGGLFPALFDDGSDERLYVTATDGQSGLELYQIPKGSPLPVELASMEGSQIGENSVQLRWTTTSETNNAGFQVQHRDGDTGSWKQFGFVESKAEGGTSSQLHTYRFNAENLSVGTHQFRVRQIDLDGTATVHESVTVNVQMRQALRLAPPAPNPVTGTATLSFAVRENATPTTLTLYNVLGQKVSTLYRDTPTAGEQQTVRLPADGLTSGVYVLRLTAGGQTRTRKVTVVR